MKPTRIGTLGIAIVLTLPCTAVPAAPAATGCDDERIATVLRVLDSSQVPEKAERLREIFQAEARVVARSPGATWDRSATEFIDGHLASKESPPLAYAFENPSTTCDTAGTALIVRRGCQVALTGAVLYEITQTEQIELVLETNTWRIRRMESQLDAMSANGKVLIENKPRVELAPCSEASESARQVEH